MSASNWHHIDDAQLRAATDKAMLFAILDEDGDTITEEWIPRSQVANPDEWNVGDRGTVSVTEWFALKVGLMGG